MATSLTFGNNKLKLTHFKSHTKGLSFFTAPELPNHALWRTRERPRDGWSTVARHQHQPTCLIKQF